MDILHTHIQTHILYTNTYTCTVVLFIHIEQHCRDMRETREHHVKTQKGKYCMLSVICKLRKKKKKEDLKAVRDEYRIEGITEGERRRRGRGWRNCGQR